jgi:hypothetical protein
MKTNRPALHLAPAHRRNLTEHFDDTMASLASYFTLEDGSAAADDMKQASAVAAALEGVVHSSDTDCAYYPCVLTGAEPLDDSFFAALGIARDAKARVSGWENPKLEVVAAGKGKGKRPALALITRLNEGELDELDDYLSEEEQTALTAALAQLETLGPIVGVQLCTDDGASKVVLTLARRESGAHVGVLTVRVET